MNLPGGWELVLVVIVIMVLFGAKRLPEASRSLGRSLRIFKAETKGLRDDDKHELDDDRSVDGPVAYDRSVDDLPVDDLPVGDRTVSSRTDSSRPPLPPVPGVPPAPSTDPRLP